MVKQLRLNNFTIFKEFAIDFSLGINIISGENSTGKTHLLKAIDSLKRILLYEENRENDPTHEQRYCTSSFIHTFDPGCNLIDLINDKSPVKSKLELKQFNSDTVKVEIDGNSPFLKVARTVRSKNRHTVYVPSKEMMFVLPDFMSLMNKYELNTDLNYQNIVINMLLPKLKDNLLNEKTSKIIKDIETLLGGTFRTGTDLDMKFYDGEVERPAKLMAEGYRKFGVLSRLIETGCISPGVSETLLLDEPETNLNPKMMKNMAEILIKLARAGQQIILVTHSYVFMKWFELLTEKDESELIQYHNLYRDEETSKIKVETSRSYTGINSNSIDAAYEEILDTQLKKDMKEFKNESD